jgi:hypothetical protein
VSETLRFSDVLAERRATDPRDHLVERTRREIAALEGEAAGAADPAERARIQCDAEALRAALDELTGRFAA